MTPREARRAGGVGPKPVPVVSAPPRGGPNRLGRPPSAAVVARDRRDPRRAVAPAQNAHGHRRDETPPAARPGGLDDFAPPPRDPPRWTRWGRWRAISAAAMARKLSQSGREGAARLSPPTQPPRSSRHAVVWASRLRMCLILVHADLEVTGVVAQFRVLAALQSHEHRSNDQTRASAHFGRCISKYMLPLARESI